MQQTTVYKDGQPVMLPMDNTTVDRLKHYLGVSPDRNLVQRENGQTHFLNNTDPVQLQDGMNFGEAPRFVYGGGVLSTLLGIASTGPAVQHEDVEIRISEKDLARLRSHLLQDATREQHAFLFARQSQGSKKLRLLVRDMSLTTPQQLVVQTAVSLELQPSYIGQTLERCRRESSSLIEVHSHPFCDRDVRLSHVDVANEREKFPWLAQELPSAHHATLVFGQSSVDGHYWNRTRNAIIPVHTLRVVGNRIQDLPITGAKREKCQDPTVQHARQVMAFGKAAQDLVGRLTVGIVGAGGLGSALAQQLAHLGVRSFLIIDHDVVEATNLNRLIGATPSDATVRRLKVDVLKRAIQDVAPDARVQALPRSVFDVDAQQPLKCADVIFGASDSDGARLVGNRLAVSHLIPYFDLGTGLEVKDGSITAAGGQMWTVLPGAFCLDCTGAIDARRARVDLRDDVERARHIARGYGSDEPAPSVVFLNTLLASVAVGEFLNLVAGYKAPQSMVAYDALAQRVESYVAPAPRPECATCARQALYAMGDPDAAPHAIREIPICDPGEPLAELV